MIRKPPIIYAGFALWFLYVNNTPEKGLKVTTDTWTIFFPIFFSSFSVIYSFILLIIILNKTIKDQCHRLEIELWLFKDMHNMPLFLQKCSGPK